MSMSYLNPMSAVTNMIPRVQPYNPMSAVTNMINPKTMVPNAFANNQSVMQNVSSVSGPIVPSSPGYTLHWGEGPNILIPNLTNPGWIIPTPMKTTSPTQNQYNWGPSPALYGNPPTTKPTTTYIAPTPVKTTAIKSSVPTTVTKTAVKK